MSKTQKQSAKKETKKGAGRTFKSGKVAKRRQWQEEASSALNRGSAIQVIGIYNR